MKVIILLAALAVAAAKPEAPLNGLFRAASAQRRTNGFQSARAVAFVAGNGRNGGDATISGEILDDFVPPSATNGAPAPVYGPPSNGNGYRNGNGRVNGNGNGHRNGNGHANGNGHHNGNGNGHANGNGHRNGNGNGHLNGNGHRNGNGNGHLNGNGHRNGNGNGHLNGNGHRNGNGNGHLNGNGHRNGNGHSNGNGYTNGNGYRNGNGNGNGNGAPARQYGPPGFQNGAPIGATEDPLAVPASYQFSYKVEDEEAGLNFGHEEAREGDEATGEYFVLLPDGRTLRVTYVANNDGYQPEITYEEPKNGGNGNGYY